MNWRPIAPAFTTIVACCLCRKKIMTRRSRITIRRSDSISKADVDQCPQRVESSPDKQSLSARCDRQPGFDKCPYTQGKAVAHYSSGDALGPPHALSPGRSTI